MSEQWNDKNLNYDKLLDDLADAIYDRKDEIETKNSEIGSFKHGYNTGYVDGIIWILTQISMREGRKSKPYKLS